MTTLTDLISYTCEHFSLRSASVQTLNAMIFSAIASGNVYQVSLARYVPSKTPEASLRRVERFFQKKTLLFSEYAPMTTQLLNFKGKFELCLDRTNWKFGKKNINYLVLSWRINSHISIPLFAKELDKAGNSDTQERIDLLEEFNHVFGYDRIGLLLADREFVGEKWFTQLIKSKISFSIRVKENTLIPYGKKPISISNLFKHLKQGEKRVILKEMYNAIVEFAGTRTKDGELVIVMSNQSLGAAKILAQYRHRWSIEEMFKKLKTSGFNFENTHMKNSNRLLTLLIIVSIAALLIYLIGVIRKTKWKKTVGCPLWSVFKRGMIYLQTILAQNLQEAACILLKTMQQAQYFFAE